LIESTLTRENAKRLSAQVLSIAGHPFIFTPIVALIVGWRMLAPLEAVLGVLTVVLASLVPVSLYIWLKVRRGEWSNLDVSEQKDRPHLFAIGIALLLFACLVLYLTHQPSAFIRGCAAAMVLVGAAWGANLWIKPSMHAGFAMVTSCSLWPLGAKIALPWIFFSVLVGWSRSALQRHTRLEVVIGLMLGAIVARLFMY
jgi:membrane-associated phospholipid phosphatase